MSKMLAILNSNWVRVVSPCLIPCLNVKFLGGFKAALHRDGTSEEAKEKARNVLASAGESEEPIN